MTRGALRAAVSAVLLLGACKTDVPKGGAVPAETASVHAGGPGALLSDGPFEGEVTFHIVKGSQTGDATYRIKGGRVRLDIGPNGSAPGGAVVYDADKNRGALLKADGSVAALIGSGERPAERPPSRAKIERTGKMDTVSGYGCELWNVVDESGKKSEACVVDGVSFASEYTQLVTWLPTGKFFLLRVVERDSAGGEATRIEVTKVEKHAVADTLFQFADTK